jgi:fibronectin type 3 domain-containing protein
MLRLLPAGLGIAILIVGISSQAKGYNEQDSQDCRGGLQANPASNVTTAPSESVASSSKGHSVRLSWSPSIPANGSPGNTIVGYNVYRREPGKSYEKVNTDLIRNNSCVDYLVKAGQTYYYETKAVSASGAVSNASSEVKAVIPSQ